MAVKLGPVLGFRGADAATWNVSALWVLEGVAAPPSVVLSAGSAAAPVRLAADGARTAWRVDLALPRAAKPQRVSYGLAGGAQSELVVPSAGQPLCLGYASCNGFSDPKYMKRVKRQNERWEDLAARHRKAPMHLLLLGGDQIYGDSIWSAKGVDALHAWQELPEKQRLAYALSAAERAAIASFYFELYCSRWSQPEVAAVLASIPTLMMWDDHDVFDGWGSYPKEVHGCDVYQGIFAEAEKAFRVFQQQLAPGALRPGAIRGAASSFAHQVDDLAIVALDLRSERTDQRILSRRSWDAALDAIDALAAGQPRHLLLMTSIPVVYPRLGAVEGLLDAIPGEQELEDDLRDHWTSRPHREERVRLAHRLLDFANRSRCRVTILSGDVHVAALGSLESKRVDAAPHAHVINQLISSAIVHVPPPRIAVFALRLLGQEDSVDRDITAYMRPFAGCDVGYLAKRNWLQISADAEHRLWAEWWAEGEKDPFRKVIHAVG